MKVFLLFLFHMIYSIPAPPTYICYKQKIPNKLGDSHSFITRNMTLYVTGYNNIIYFSSNQAVNYIYSWKSGMAVKHNGGTMK